MGISLWAVSSDEAHQDSVWRRLLYIAIELKICCSDPIITSETPIEKPKRIAYQDFKEIGLGQRAEKSAILKS